MLQVSRFTSVFAFLLVPAMIGVCTADMIIFHPETPISLN